MLRAIWLPGEPQETLIQLQFGLGRTDILTVLDFCWKQNPCPLGAYVLVDAPGVSSDAGLYTVTRGRPSEKVKLEQRPSDVEFRSLLI